MPIKHADLFPGITDVDRYLQETFRVAQLNTPERRALFLANVAHESAFLTKLVENLKYSKDRLIQVWPNRFGSPAGRRKAERIEYDEYAIAEAVYGGRFGNGPEGSGDGWKYRGRGAIQLTFKSNYNRVSNWLKLGDLLVKEPQLVATPQYALLTAAVWWTDNKMNAYADRLAGKTSEVKSDILEEARKKVNGGTLGLKEVKKLFDIFCF